MKLFSFETILVLIILAFSVMALWSTIQRTKKLGEKVKGTLSGLKYADKTQFILVIFLGVFTFAAFQLSMATNNPISLFNIAFAVTMVVFFANTLYISMIPKGFFKNGISTFSGVLSYDEVVTYEMVARPKNNTVRVRFNPKKSIFGGSGSYIEIDPSEEAEVKAYLKKHCSFKKKTYTPPPKKKKN